MRVLEKTAAFKKNSKKPLVLALGNFDGIHLGHQKLLKYVVSQAQKIGGQAAVFTFRKHPQAVLHPRHVPENLQALEQKLELFRAHGIQICFLQRFDRPFSALSAQDFIKKILVKQLGIYEICLGYNARFGHGREGDADLLRDMGRQYGFKVFQSEPIVWRGTPISSTAVREAIRCGKVDLAAKLLGRPWSIVGRVIRGEARGKKLGYPTANIDLSHYVRPRFGVYAVNAKIKKVQKNIASVANFGLRPTFDYKEKPILEAYLFNFKKSIYGKKIEISFVKKLRDENKFNSAVELKKQIQKDIEAAWRALKRQK